MREATGWSVEDRRGQTRPAVAIQTGDGRCLRVVVASNEALWLQRARHPAYARYVRPAIEALSEAAMVVELRASLTEVVAVLVTETHGELFEAIVPLPVALLLFDPEAVSLVVEDELLDRSAERLVELERGFWAGQHRPNENYEGRRVYESPIHSLFLGVSTPLATAAFSLVIGRPTDAESAVRPCAQVRRNSLAGHSHRGHVERRTS